MDAFVPRFAHGRTRALKVEAIRTIEATVIGPDDQRERDAARAEAWVQEAVEQGAHLLMGGSRRGGATAADNPCRGDAEHATPSLCCEEAFAPAVSIIPVDDLDDAVARSQLDPLRPRRGHLREGRHARPSMVHASYRVGVVHINEPFEQPCRLDALPRVRTAASVPKARVTPCAR